MTRKLAILIVVAILGWLATGLYVVDADEQGLVRRFGRLVPEVSPPGLNYDLPWPLSSVTRVRTDETRQVSVGFAPPEERVMVQTSIERLSEFFTGDQNLIHVQATAQFRIREPAAYLLGHRAPEALLSASLETALTESVTGCPVDFLLTDGRRAVGTQVLERTQQLADGYGLGVEVLSVDLSSVRPPALIDRAFRDAANARSDKEKLIHEARSYVLKELALAAGRERRILDEAATYRDEQTARARGKADAFASMIDQFERIDDPQERDAARSLTMFRLWTESITRILPQLKRGLFIDPGDKVDVNILGQP